jgi:hypothetical protein
MSAELQVTKEEYVDWKHNPVTQGIKSLLVIEKEALEETIISGVYLHDIIQQAKLIGELKGINRFLGIDWEDVTND